MEPVASGTTGGGVSTQFRITVHSESYDIHLPGANPVGKPSGQARKGDRVAPGESLIGIE